MTLIKNLILPIFPSMSMVLSSLYFTFPSSYDNSLRSFTSGLLLVSVASLLGEINSDKKRKYGILGMVISISFISLLNYFIKNSGALTSLYFDSISDGLLLGVLISAIKNIKALYLVVFSMTFEMFITAYSMVTLLGDESRQIISFAGVVLFSAGLVGHYFYKFINESVVIGFGISSMMWLAFFEFLPSLKFSFSSYFFILLGILFGSFI